MNNSKYYIDFVSDGMYNVLVRRSDEAILDSSEDLDELISIAKKRGIKDNDITIY